MRLAAGTGPIALSEVGVRAVLRVAVARVRARAADRLGPIADLAETPGYLRRLRGRVASWRRSGRRSAPEGAGADWLFAREYRKILKQRDADDAEGLAIRAARRLRHDPPPGFERFESVTILEPTSGDLATRAALEAFRDRAETLCITLPWDPARPEAFATVRPIRERLLSWGFVDEFREDDGPTGIVALGRDLFRDDATPIAVTTGVTILGAPQGEGESALVARRLRELIDEGVPPEEILVVFRRWDDAAGLAADVAKAWGLPVAGGRWGPLASMPAVAALRLAAAVAAEDWDVARLVRLLRHGQVRPDWPELAEPLAMTRAATALTESRAFRGRDVVRDALRRAAVEPGPGDESPDLRRRRRRAARARIAEAIVGRLGSIYDTLARPGPWADQVDRLRRLADALGIGRVDGRPALESLYLALDEHGPALDGGKRAGRNWTWASFVREVDRVARELELPTGPEPVGAVRFATVDEAEGVRARHVILAGLVEGTFPAREAILSDRAAEPDDPEPSRSFGREMLRFLRVVGAAEAGLTLTYPTTDEKGQALLPAVFLDETLSAFAPDAQPPFAEPIRTLDPTLTRGLLAGTPADLRLQAMALACQEEDLALLKQLSDDPEHRPALDGVALALRVAHEREAGREFGRFDGKLGDAEAIRKIAADFGPDRPAFSPSQLETLAACPFRFFLRYVLRLEPPDELEEFRDDRAAAGSLAHRVLEELHLQLGGAMEDAGESPADLVETILSRIIQAELDTQGPDASPVEEGLRRIEAGRLERVGKRYAKQFREYLTKLGASECHHVEVAFGEGKPGGGLPPLVLGEEPETVQLQGKIDRIDLIRLPDRTLFRVIDYKTGHAPAKSDVVAGLALQLPLYALAVERLALAGRGARPLDVGYWALGKKGYRAVVAMANADGEGLDSWEAFRPAMEAFVLELVGNLRRAAFPVAPREDDCRQRCDYPCVCRIAQVQAARKVWESLPTLKLPPS